jgi:wyosine [tRNA(Phe)-imidazoG37] synthetase (radical SAM superfamily)
MIIFGPTPSRRLGRSLGINNIPFKICSYSCVYCQVGRTNSLSIKRREFYKPEQILYEVENKLNQLNEINEKINYITIVPDGEPTIDANLGLLIGKLKTLGYKIAVITNSSLISDKSVQTELMEANLISLKIDSVDTEIWRKINRPHNLINLKVVKEGIIEFASRYKNVLYTETMLVKGVNDNFCSLFETGQFIAQLNPKKAFILIPTRPPAENVNPPENEQLKSAKQIFSSINHNFEFIDYNEGTNFTFYNNFEKELLSIISVHPMSKDAVKAFIKKANLEWDTVNKLIKEKIIKEIQFKGNSFFKINK